MRDDDFFGNDMNDIVRQFFGGVNGRRSRKRENFEEDEEIEEDEEGNKIEIVDLENELHFIFDLAGYDEKDLRLEVKDKTLIVQVKKKGECKMQDYLSKKLCRGETIKKTLAPYLDIKNFKHSIKNGILEVKFEKK